MTTREHHQEAVVIELTDHDLRHLRELFQTAFPDGRDDFLDVIPAIRQQLDQLQIDQPECAPAGQLRLSRSHALHLSDLLDRLNSPLLQSMDVSDAANKIREHAHNDQELVTFTGTRIGWSDPLPSSADVPAILITVRNSDGIHQPDRFRHAFLAEDSCGGAIYQIDVMAEQLRATLEATPLGQESSFTVRVQREGRLALAQVGA